ncbi:fused MFS/spermidine synthase [Demequina capsici]|uniref:Fused MFS/spermidine synthase n=1 Tax=Demequina capsici TaxID=3075620 RepID=A0AA96F9H0_9MICO|nr:MULTISPECIES: fused MFS/spermidine synthase [unclassified Demequina]WNM23361.1 fused MFS/spermidine synthase [Demequina sp. OYTSA14]WNM26238.1 fused MFS/spermidine synthase [Demequina sp. PMTSA13]
MARRRHSPNGVAVGVPREVEFPIATGVALLRDEPDGTTFLWVNGVPSSPLRADPEVLDFEYMQHMSAAVAVWSPPPRMLAMHVGAAACAFPRHLAHRYPDSGHIAVDIDATLPELVRGWWDLPKAPRLRIRAQDGLEALATRADDSLDLVVRDAFSGADTPSHLADQTWWAEASRVLRHGGLVLANVGTRPGGTSARTDLAAARAAMGAVTSIGEHAVLKGRRRGNIVLAASTRLDTDALARYAASASLPTGIRTDWTP